jgi:hypothetical protein
MARAFDLGRYCGKKDRLNAIHEEFWSTTITPSMLGKNPLCGI